MDFYLNDPDSSGVQFRFPVNPEEVQITRSKSFETVNILGLGEIDFPFGEKVREVTFSSFFPKEYDSSYCRYRNIPDPQQAMQILTKFMNSQKPVRLIITNTQVNVLVLVSSHNSTFKGGEPDDVYFDITCRTWRDVKVRTSLANQSSDRTDTKPVQKVYVVKSGDTLFSISKRELGNSSRWRALYEKNKAIIGHNPDIILPGQKLVML